jgi:hypothetical protein
MIDNVVFSILIVAIAFGTWLLLRAAVRSNRKYPFSERVCLLVLRFSAWLQCVGNAWDFAIVRYRIECRDVCLDMESTAERLNAKDEADTGRALDYMDQEFGPFPSQERAARHEASCTCGDAHDGNCALAPDTGVEAQ